MTWDLDLVFKWALGFISSYLLWDKQRDKAKAETREERLTRLEERHCALVDDVKEMKNDVKIILRKTYSGENHG